MIDADRVRFDRHIPFRKNRFDFRSEEKSLAVGVIVQRLFADAVSGQKQGPRSAVPDGKGEHAAQAGQAIATVFFIRVNDRFRVAGRFELMAPGFQILPQLLEVINFAVESNPYGSVLIAHRLAGFGAKVDDREPPVCPFRARPLVNMSSAWVENASAAPISPVESTS